jgi:hypothetical protein
MKTIKLHVITGLLAAMLIGGLLCLCSCGGRASGRNQSQVVYSDTPRVNSNAVIVYDKKPAKVQVYDTVHIGARGARYVMAISKKTGKPYRKYLK